MQKEVKKAFQAKTRDMSGNPGPNYWQNRAKYVIQATLDTVNHSLIGEEMIYYFNNSPDTLESLFFNLYQDIYKKGTVRDWDMGPVDLHDGVKISTLEISSKGKIWKFTSQDVRRYATTMGVRLPEKLLPGDSLKVEIHWEFPIPKKRPVRMGTYHKSNFVIAYWYPKIAVYDDILGWNREPYSGYCEFYNDFSDYQVSLNLPSNYLAWSSGELQNAEEIYSSNVINKLAQANESSDVISIITDKKQYSKVIKSKSPLVSWRFKAENMVDFAFALSDNALWDATSIQSGKRRVLIHAVYQKESNDFFEVAKLTQQILDFYTHETPGYPFPFPQITVFNGRGGMEYPGMVNDGSNKDFNKTVYLTAHEVGHSYFPFYTGLNEQRYAWMDEGLITFFPRKVVQKLTRDSSFYAFEEMLNYYKGPAGTSSEIPLMIPSTNTGSAYRFHAYAKPSVAFFELEKYLGTEVFNAGLQLFIKRWKGKHPIPWDLFFTFNEVAKEDLVWFWKPWFFSIELCRFESERKLGESITCKKYWRKSN